jgi:hypothetical protein
MARKTASGYASEPLMGAPARSVTVRNFVTAPTPTILPVDNAGHAAAPYPEHMVAGLPFPHGAQVRLAHWNRVNGGPGMPAGVTYNAPKDRMSQT